MFMKITIIVGIVLATVYLTVGFVLSFFLISMAMVDVSCWDRLKIILLWPAWLLLRRGG